ncbi:multiheme c-type cytochrome [Simiduia curdlanivorans]|uniref:Multiheme c-type cytochrome n=1 Tax=Simiduia curdlanivorans TaxID=1492769 RepID=A0ABV8UYE3_9GAMM|nr:multiheme c-type cytochrome [Simiduia curdlanivorans]MDN3640307.1 multiheme c-type cytochrome [Simiduia curdlanivorans]
MPSARKTVLMAHKNTGSAMAIPLFHKFCRSNRLAFVLALSVGLLAAPASFASSSKYGDAVAREYQVAPPSPRSQTQQQALEKSTGCVSCHTASDSKTMHVSQAISLGCSDCHGGNAKISLSQGAQLIRPLAGEQLALMQQAHVLPRFPDAWPSSRNPVQTYALLNQESREFVRFINPSDYRVAEQACGACHQEIIEASKRSMHTTGAMLWGGASYNNGILPYKNYILGESYDDNGQAQVILGPVIPEHLQEAAKAAGIIDKLYPLPAWETVKPGDNFRVFEDGGRNLLNLFPETGIPNSLGLIQRLEEPGRPDIRQSNRGPGTGQRISVPILNITKTRLNDPLTWFMGTNDQPGDYRHSGCASCHVVYANDRDERHSGPYAKFGHSGQSTTTDPTIDKTESGHPLTHTFTRAVPTSQCMICHMHQPNMFMNTFLGYTMWDYESDAAMMWPKEQQYPSAAEMREVLDRNPEGAAPRGNWANLDFLKSVWEKNDQMQDTQFADYHGHGWNFRAVFKRDRSGNLLDDQGSIVANDDPKKFDKAVHMSSIHVDVGMHCVDCHFAQDNHGNGFIYGEVAMAVEVSCVDCHGTESAYPSLFTSGPAALEGGTNMSLMRTPDGRKRFEWQGDTLFQRSMLYPDKEWQMSLVKDSVNANHNGYNEKAARAKLMRKDTEKQHWGPANAGESQDLAHGYDNMECYACHTSWTNTCGGCHLPIEANAKTERHHYEGGESRNFATYNPQVAGDQMYLLGKRSPAKGGKVAPVRSSSALVLSSTNANREKIYIQQPPVAASGYSSQAFNAHYPHTARKTETKTCTDCHLSADNDNNAIMAQLLMQGTNAVSFLGYNAWLGSAGAIDAVKVTEWDEPQAVIGSYLQRYAYPDYFAAHLDNKRQLQDAKQHSANNSQCLQLRGEYLFSAEADGLKVYDAANIANKGFSQALVSAPVSPLGQDTRIKSRAATCVALPSVQPIAPERNQGDLMRIDNQEQPFHPLYHYALITDAEEGLILTNVDTLADGIPTNNFLARALTWNDGGILTGARHLTIAGHFVYITTPSSVVILDLDQPLKPKLAAVLPVQDARATSLQFRYLFVTSGAGLSVVNITNPYQPQRVEKAFLALNDGQKMSISRAYLYVAAGEEGLVIVDIERPEAPKLLTRFNAGGSLNDSRDVVVAATNASLFAYVADGRNGLKVIQLFSPASQPNFYGFNPEPKPELIAHYPTDTAAQALSRPLPRDRGVDETGGQIAVFGRKGARPFTAEEAKKLYLNANGKPWTVTDNAKGGQQ